MRRPRWTTTTSALFRVAACLTVMAGAAGCGGSDAPPEIDLLTSAEWNDDPPSLDKLGYQVSVDFGWPNRSQSCFPMPPDLLVTMNEREVTPTQLGDCVWDILVHFDAVPPGPVHVRVASGSRVWGEADFDDLFPGFGAALADPGDGTVQAGSQFTVNFPATAVPSGSGLGYGEFYWLDTPTSEVPFYTFAQGMDGADLHSVVITAPAITGRATMVVKSVFNGGGFSAAKSCTGFKGCTGWPSSQAAGPIDVEVVP